MDEEVDDGRPSGVGLAEVGEHGYENGQVMVPDVERWCFICNWIVFCSPVEKDQLLFSENDEDGVAQLENFRESEHPSPKGHRLNHND